MNKKRNRRISLFVIPGLLGIAIFFMIPLAITVGMSFGKSGDISLQNYQSVLQSKAFRLALRNTLRLIATGIPITMIIGVVCAVVFQTLLRNRLPGAQFLFLMYLLPLVLPSAVVVMFVEYFLPYSDAPEVTCLMTGMYVWKNVPYALLAVFLGLRNIPEDIYGAAQLDGAGPMQMLRRILLPLLTPYLLVGLVLSFLGVFRIYRESFLLFGNYPDQSVYYLQNYMNNLLNATNYGNLAAASDLFLAGLAILLFTVLYALGKERHR